MTNKGTSAKMRITWGKLKKKDIFNPPHTSLKERIARHKENHPNDRTFES